MTDYTVINKAKLAPQRIADTITAGVEGGIAYWADQFFLSEPGSAKLTEEPWYCDGKLYAADDFVIEVRQEEEHVQGAGTKLTIRRADIDQALAIMAEKYKWHFDNIVNENEDSETGDVLIQLAAFKEIVYG